MFLKIKKFYRQVDDFLFFEISHFIFRFWINRDKNLTRVVDKYKLLYKEYVKGTTKTFTILAILVALYFFLTKIFSDNDFVKTNEQSIKDWLQLLFTLAGVVYGVFLSQLIQFLTVPDKEVMLPLDKYALFAEFFGVLKDFIKKHEEYKAKDKEELVDNEETSITILLGAPLLIDFKEVETLISKDVISNSDIQFQNLIQEIFDHTTKVKKKIICLSNEAHSFQGVSPLQRFIKTFSGYMITCNHDKTEKTKEDFYNDLDIFRKNLTKQINAFLNQRKEHIFFSKEDDLQWQAIVIQIPAIRFYKAVVGFYSEDFFKKNSRLSLMGEILDIGNLQIENRGFETDSPDIIDWIMDGLVNPYLPRNFSENDHIKEQPLPTNEVHDEIVRTAQHKGASDTGVGVMSDNLNNFFSVEAHYEYGNNSIIKNISYPIFDGKNSTITLTHCQYLFHPLIAESSAWTSMNLRLPGGSSCKILDMCCGIGVQGITAMSKGAKYIQGVDEDPISLLCCAINYKKALSYLNKPDVEIYVSLADGFKKSFSFNEFHDIFFGQLDSPIWRDKLKPSNKNELKQLFDTNAEFIKSIYKETIEPDFDLIILEPPFVDFTMDQVTPAYPGLYDCHFDVVRMLLAQAGNYLKIEEDKKDWEKPYIFQSFSSIEDIAEFEMYLEKKEKYMIFKKSCIQQDKKFWYSYHLIPMAKQ